jgi:hypothetical protein
MRSGPRPPGSFPRHARLDEFGDVFRQHVGFQIDRAAVSFRIPPLPSESSRVLPQKKFLVKQPGRLSS